MIDGKVSMFSGHSGVLSGLMYDLLHLKTKQYLKLVTRAAHTTAKCMIVFDARNDTPGKGFEVVDMSLEKLVAIFLNFSN
jgi:hypothetical protein